MGVCTKLGKATGIDSYLFRFLFIAWFIMSPGTSVLVYVLSALLIWNQSVNVKKPLHLEWMVQPMMVENGMTMR